MEGNFSGKTIEGPIHFRGCIFLICKNVYQRFCPLPIGFYGFSTGKFCLLSRLETNTGRFSQEKIQSRDFDKIGLNFNAKLISFKIGTWPLDL